MTIRRILVPVVGDEGEGKTLALAFRTAKKTNALVDVLFVAPNRSEALPPFGEGFSPAAMEEVRMSAKRRAEARLALANKMFEDVCCESGARVVTAAGSGSGPSGRFIVETGPLLNLVAYHACVCDLVVVSNAMREASVFEAVLLEAGRPVLLVPNSDLPATLADNVLIAWRHCSEAGHAVCAALPLLTGAKSVTVTMIKRGVKDAGIGPETITPLSDYLTCHGIRFETRVVESGPRTPSQVITQTAAEMTCDLLVMGGYGHSRLREFVIGGVTRDVTTAAQVPILMMH